MATDSIKDLTAQLEADLKHLRHQIDGMENHIAGANTPELKAGLEDPPLATLVQRQGDLEVILDDLVKLGEDIQVAESRPQPWPDPVSFTLSDELAVQFAAQNRNNSIAYGLFNQPGPPPPAMATGFELSEGPDVPKSPPLSSRPSRPKE